MPDASARSRRLGLGLAIMTIGIAVVVTQWRFHFDATRFGMHVRWNRIDWHWFPRTPMGHVRLDKDFALNLLMLVPLGIGFALWRRASGLRIVIEALLLGFATSALLELAQLANAYRYTTFADVWRNTLGCVVGAIVIVALRRSAKVSPSPSASGSR
ncbi:MAG TPA: VanZ family protein [Kofleriaceae bacterium]|nr:VanZ family protein [Kofleriaceae bacterium]